MLQEAAEGKRDFIQADRGAVRQQGRSNFPDYPVPKMAKSPVIGTHLVPSTVEPGSVGEMMV
ncbi:hypothetical protein K2O51_07850 [Cupriavidus pinatubonensis]|uniref:hypothetical protein n=1 Tax=Cupriavidus pinatubonensis TaxID=248026 RepID=UPI001C72EA13|nr:hypothetical protein [Cupriavidus pinatubonensis]QYY27832.1 hypothetical protein K2O51_07850 [Cupriavidus pinatubonensis]